MPIGTMRSGCGEYHSSKNQSFHAVTASPRSASLQRENTEPQKPVICDGKFTDAHTPLMSMSRTRVHVVTRGAHLLEAGRLDLPVFGLAPDHRVEPDLEEDLAVELPDLVALFGLDDLGRVGLQLRRGSRPSNMLRRLDEVVVGGEEGVANRARLGIGQQAVRLALAPAQPNGVGVSASVTATGYVCDRACVR